MVLSSSGLAWKALHLLNGFPFMVDNAPVRRVTRWGILSDSAILGLDLSLLYTNFLSPARVSHTCVLLLGNLYDQVRIVSFERQLLDEGDKLGKCGVVHLGALFLISKGVLLPSALDIARKLRNDRFNVSGLVEDSEASVSAVILSTL